MKIGAFGLGIIGSVWAENLAADGHEVLRWNRSPKKAPGFTASAREVAEKSEMMIIVVADPPAVQNVLDQILPVLRPNQIVIQSSTISPEATQNFARQIEAKGASFLEAPFTGSKPAAEKREMVFFIGGDKAVLERARPALQPLSKAIEYIGALGTASALKLALNINAALVIEALCESLTLARAAGISDERYFSILKLNTAHTKMADMKQPKLQSNEFSPQFSLKHMAKDIRLALGSAGNLDLPQTKSLSKLYEQALSKGWGEDDFVSLIRLLARPRA